MCDVDPRSAAQVGRRPVTETALRGSRSIPDAVRVSAEQCVRELLSQGQISEWTACVHAASRFGIHPSSVWLWWSADRLRANL